MNGRIQKVLGSDDNLKERLRKSRITYFGLILLTKMKWAEVSFKCKVWQKNPNYFLKLLHFLDIKTTKADALQNSHTLSLFSINFMIQAYSIFYSCRNYSKIELIYEVTHFMLTHIITKEKITFKQHRHFHLIKVEDM